MSDHGSKPVKEEYFDYKNVGSHFVVVAVVALIALVLCFGLALSSKANQTQFAFSWLFAFTYFFTICAGGLFWQLVHYGTDAEWSVVVRRQMENIACLAPVMMLLFIPLIFVRNDLWTWMTKLPGQDVLLDEKAAYLNPTFFWIRAAFYFTFFTAAAFFFHRNSVAQDKNGLAKYTVRARKATFASLPFFAVCLTFAAIDWLMGLDYHWFSTMWGVYIFAGTALSSMCVLVLIIRSLQNAGYFKDVITIEHYHLMGKWMLAFTVFWAYIGFDQYMLIWYANIPEETVYYLLRNTGSWCTLNWMLVVGHFFIPFVFLLQQPLKARPRLLCIVAVWVLIMHMLDIYIIVMPVLHRTGIDIKPLDILSLVAIGSTLAAVFLKRLGNTPLWPIRDPRLSQSLHTKN
ncbi:MAG: hypothetical protein ABI615_00870 [Chthoniobacterales bacterium]